MPPTANVLQVRPTFHPFQKQSAAHKSEETADLVVFSSAVSAARGGQGLSEVALLALSCSLAKCSTAED